MYSKWNTSSYPTWNYRKINKGVTRYSAGILPYTFDQDGKCFFLLGKDNDNDWSDFGGRCEFKDRSEPINTAVREFYEETLGSVINIEECITKLGQNPVKIVSKTLNGSPYYMYLMYIENINYSDTFNKTAQFLRYQFDKQEMNKLIEKNTIRWVSMDTVLLCIENKNAPISLRGVFYTTMINSQDQLQFLIKGT
jgi:8-oxo-dGTP pyrophosphatase MutT (NUDIX family)